jgi:prepilin-type N-terminal cleavage/methylation domain-containing protein/prepilin-type processing-associated H-X9-DG protein
VKKAFTLIELLVVIAIIAILAAILFPVFAAAREKARQAGCSSNEKQIGLAIAEYTQDYDEMLPGREMGNPGQSWRVTIYPYLKNIQVFSCPSNPNNKQLSNDGYTARSYACNGNDDNTPGLTPMHANGGAPISQIQYPAQLILFTESVDGWSDIPGSYNFNGGLFASHSGDANIAFADGHVKAMKPTSTVNLNINEWSMDGNPGQKDMLIRWLVACQNYYK